ncbi:MAG: AAA family ATPase [Actinomycetota bacterium]
MQICPNCGEENPDRFRLCGFCGTPLTVEEKAESVRKTVTILFCDLKGSTPLGEKLDPESLREVLALYFNEMRSVLKRHGGKVEKYIGDAIVAVFGLPRAHEDDALRAVRAAYDMQRALERANEIIEARWDVRLQNRTGVNTGEVIAGDASASQHLVTGDAVNTAARLEQNAPADQVLIGEPTYRLVKDAIEAEAVEPLELKGKAERFPAYLLVAVKGDEAIKRRVDTPMVGRVAEMATLMGAFEDTTTGPSAHLVTVFGPPGVGKSRLLHEFLTRVGDRVTTVHGRCLSYGEGITFWPLAEIVRAVTGVTDDDDLEAARAKVHSFLDEQAVADRISSAMGLSDVPYSVNETYWAAARFFAQLSCERPLVAVVDDIHWAEQAFLDLLQWVTRTLERSPVLFLCSSRPELLEEHEDWGSAERQHDVVLHALTAEESATVIENILGTAAIDERARARIIAAAEGNPLFVEQMVSMLIEDGVIQLDQTGGWTLVRDLESFAMPASISALIAARLDRLSPIEQSVIQRAAVIGQNFFRDAVEHLLPESSRPGAAAAMVSLLGKGLITASETSFAGLHTYRFQHILIRDGAYAGMLKRSRAELHEAFVDWVERANPDRVMEFEEIRGYHLEQAFIILGGLGPLDEHAIALGRRGSQHLAAAGRRAVTRADMHAAANLLQRAAGLVPEDDGTRPRLLIDAAEALFEVGEFAMADTCLLSAIETASSLTDHALKTTARIVRLQFRFMAEGEGQEDALIDDAEQAIELLENAGDQDGAARAWRLLYFVHGTACRYSAAREAAERIMEHARLAGNPVLAQRFLAGIVTCALYGPTPVPELIELCEQTLTKAGDDRKTRAIILKTVAHAESMKGDFTRVRDLYGSARAALEELGWNLLAALVSHASGPIEMARGDLEAAEAELRRDYAALDAMGERNYISTTAAWLAEALYRQGKYDESLHYSQACEKVAASDDLTSQFLWRCVRAKVDARAGRFDEAEAFALESVRMIRRSDDTNSQAHALMDLAEVLQLTGKTDEAVAAILEAKALFEQKGNVVSVEESATRLVTIQPAPAMISIVDQQVVVNVPVIVEQPVVVDLVDEVHKTGT